MKRIIVYTIFLIFATSLCSCIGYYRDMTHLSEDELQWVNCVGVGDTILFDSDSLHCDTMVITSKIIRNSRNRFFIHFVDNYMGDFYEATADYRFFIRHSTDSLPRAFRMKKLIDIDSIEWRIYFYGLFSKDWPFKYRDYDARPIYREKNPYKKTNFALSGKELNECLLFDQSNTIYPFENQPAGGESCIFSKEYGLIYYKLKSGEEFFRRFE